MASTKDALKLLRGFPRVALNNIKQRKNLPKSRTKDRKKMTAHRGQRKHGTLPPLGFEGGQTPFHIRIPKEPYYRDVSQRKEYVPLSLLQLQRMIDLARVDVNKPVDLTALCNSKLLDVEPSQGHYGIHLTDEGADFFDAQVCLEVQWADELAIAAVERTGSIITSRYYDPLSLHAVTDPEKFFKRGEPIPTCKTPTSDVLEYYSNAKFRGYLADPEEVEKEREILAQKYGYQLPPTKESVKELASRKKHMLQIFYGLEPGWVVNLADKEIVKPTDPQLIEFYNTESML